MDALESDITSLLLGGEILIIFWLVYRIVNRSRNRIYTHVDSVDFVSISMISETQTGIRRNAIRTCHGMFGIIRISRTQCTTFGAYDLTF